MYGNWLVTLVLSALVAVSAAELAGPHDPDRRIRNLNQEIAERPDDARLYLRRGELYRQRGDLSLARSDYHRAGQLDPELSEVDFALALIHLDTEQQTQALQAIRRFLDSAPEHGQAQLTRARILVRLLRHTEAAAAYELALDNLEHRPQHFLERARTQVDLGRIAAAISGLEAGIAELGPVVSLMALAMDLEVERGEYDRALSRVDRMLAIAARREPWYSLRSEILTKAGRPREAENARQAALDAAEAHLDGRFRPPPDLSPRPAHADPTPGPAPGSTLVLPGAVWRYLDDGSDQGVAWRDPDFDDSAWESGSAELGYGDGDEVTVVSFGPDPLDKHVTTYFRHEFQVDDTGALRSATLRLVRDDGAVIYLNGTEVARSNMPPGEIGWNTPAWLGIAGSDESLLHSFPLEPNLLENGTNVLAVEIHQYHPASSDISFALELLAEPSVLVVRGPYLQRGTPDSAVIRWRTNSPTTTVAWVGTSVESLWIGAHSAVPTTEHEAVVTDLLPNTKYFYGVGDGTGVLAGLDQDHTFTTSPPFGTAKPTRIWVIGDSGLANANAAAVRDAFLDQAADREADVWLMLGDNAYDFGTDAEYQAAVFDMYPTVLRSTFLWPTLGNHDGLSAFSSTESGVYYDIFTLPRQGEAGGLPSGTEAYYSFDYGDTHFICLDSHDTDRSPTGAMMTWLKADLADTSARWNIAYWHHPPYSKGSHDSDKDLESFGKLKQMRENALPILEAGGVDLVLTGHSHSYERSFLLDGHYGKSNTLSSAMKLDPGDGRELGDGAYGKPTAGPAGHEGAVYVVAGSSSRLGPGTLDHPAMFISLSALGSMVIDINGNRLDARFVDSTATVRDSFTLIKGVERSLTRDEPRISITTGGTQRLFLDAGPEYGGRGYLVGGSFGTSPGFDVGLVHIPLNPDWWLQLSLAQANSVVYQNTDGLLDAQGQAEAVINVPAMNVPELIGQVFYHAFVVHDGVQVLMASNSVKLRLAN